MVFVPIWRSDEEMDLVLGRAREITADWDPLFFKIDDRDQYKPGYKFADWEVKGVPIRIELGPRDLENQQAVVVRRDTGEKLFVPRPEIKQKVAETLEAMQKDLFERAKTMRDEFTFTVDTREEFERIVLLPQASGTRLTVGDIANVRDRSLSPSSGGRDLRNHERGHRSIAHRYPLGAIRVNPSGAGSGSRLARHVFRHGPDPGVARRVPGSDGDG